MNILLDYFFPITAIEPTAAASTAFLKQVCVVGLPKDGGVTTGEISLITTADDASDYFGAAAAAEVSKLFDAGMNRVYVLPMDDLNLASALEGHEAEFFTILITSDFDAEDMEEVTEVAEVKSYRKIQDILFTSKLTGVAGDAITINYDSGASSGEANVSVDGTDITVEIEDGVTTAATIAAQIAGTPAADALVSAAVDEGDETDPQDVFGAALSLQNGVDAVVASESGFDQGDFKGVVGISSDDDDFLGDQAAISNRCAFHTTTTNKAKNMFYAFGKMLSNASNWRNQQYITVPLADDVDTLGEANALFDDKISFVISDDEFGERLALFAAGGKAIVAPYIRKNLEIDMQSAGLSFVSGNQPAYTKANAALLEDELQKVIQSYIDRKLIEAGTVSIELVEDNFVATGDINISEPKALWRVFAEMRQTL